jgi:uncharacterized membrane protein
MKRNNTVEPKKPTSGDMQLKIQHQEQRFEGPIPPPAVLQGYEQILPGAAERILRMAEQQAAHRHSLELKSINANI